MLKILKLVNKIYMIIKTKQLIKMKKFKTVKFKKFFKTFMELKKADKIETKYL